MCFHCGEIKDDEEVAQMLQCGFIDRIGHGTFIDGMYIYFIITAYNSLINIL